MIEEFDLQSNKWLSDMFDMRDVWIPSYFRDFPLSGLMRTTSRSECENYVFSNYMHHEANLMNFMVSFESAMEKQRHNQSLFDYKSATTTSKLRTPLPIEKHALEVYTYDIFLIVQREIYYSVWSCIQESVVIDNECEVYILKDKKKNFFKKASDKELVDDDDEDSDLSYQKSLPDLCPDKRYKVCHLGLLFIILQYLKVHM